MQLRKEKEEDLLDIFAKIVKNVLAAKIRLLPVSASDTNTTIWYSGYQMVRIYIPNKISPLYLVNSSQIFIIFYLVVGEPNGTKKRLGDGLLRQLASRGKDLPKLRPH
ncbi:MAG: hypothetical protein ABIG87_01410 [Patescibacteria group bacterium]